VVVLQEPVREASAAEPEEDAGHDSTVAPAPTLAAPQPTSTWRPKDGGTPDPCGALQRAQDRDASAALITKLQERCRATKKPGDIY
jgi:hypothetical protein